MIAYRMLYRPAGFATLPSKLGWEYVEVPPGHPNPFGLPVSHWMYGVIATERPLTADELQSYEIAIDEDAST